MDKRNSVTYTTTTFKEVKLISKEALWLVIGLRHVIWIDSALKKCAEYFCAEGERRRSSGFVKINLNARYIAKRCTAIHDEVAEWLRRWTANPMCSALVGSNPILVEVCLLVF